MLTSPEEYTDHPYHEEEYEEFEPYPYKNLKDREQLVFIEERKVYDSDDMVSSFSIIVLCNTGEGYKPVFEIQHEPRNEYPEAVNLKKDGLTVWELNSNYIRLGNFDCNYQPDFAEFSEHECYHAVKEEHFDTIVPKILNELEKFRPEIA